MMRRRSLLLITLTPPLLYVSFLAAYSGIAGKHPSYNFSAARVAMYSITAAESRSHVDRLASVEFKGRETGSIGEWLAAKYIAREFAKYGLLPAGDDGSYFQYFQVERGALKAATLLVTKTGPPDNTRRAFSLKHDFVPFSFTGENSIVGSVVFAGYGITAPEYQYDDYQKLNVKDKIVLVLRHEPQENDPKSVFAGAQLTHHAHFEEKARTALAHGAAGMLLVSDPASGHESLEPQSYWPSQRNDRWAPRSWQLTPNEGLESFPAMWIRVEVAEEILKSADEKLAELQQSIDRTGQPHSLEIANLRVQLTIDLESDTRRTQNVIGFLKGSDPQLRDEAVVVGAHFDHIGVINDRIYRGADDNASGTSGLLEIAEAFAELSGHHRRSVLFIAFSAEEMGLLGSEFYVKEPFVPLPKTVAMLNLDMIGRNAENEVTVIGSRFSPELNEINVAANEEIGLHLKYNGEHFFNRSDQANFARQNIPVLFYNTDSHEDYHRPTDVPEKIISEKVSRIARLAFLVAWETANADERPSYIQPRPPM